MRRPTTKCAPAFLLEKETRRNVSPREKRMSAKRQRTQWGSNGVEKMNGSAFRPHVGGSGEVLDGTLGATFSDSLLADVLLRSEDEQVDNEEHEEGDDEEEHVREVEEQEREEVFGGDLDALQQLLKEKEGIIQSSTRLAKAQIDRLTEELHAERK